MLSKTELKLAINSIGRFDMKPIYKKSNTWQFSNQNRSAPPRREIEKKRSTSFYTLSHSVDTLVTFVICNFCRLRGDFEDDGQLDSTAQIAPSARSNPTARRRRNHLEVCKSSMTKVTRVSTLSMGQSIANVHTYRIDKKHFQIGRWGTSVHRCIQRSK